MVFNFLLSLDFYFRLNGFLDLITLAVKTKQFEMLIGIDRQITENYFFLCLLLNWIYLNYMAKARHEENILRAFYVFVVRMPMVPFNLEDIV